jgi:DNA replication protein DnaC
MFHTMASIIESDAPDIQSTCKNCGVPVTMPGFLERWASRSGIFCDDCAAADSAIRTAEMIANTKAARLARWNAICPPDFQLTTASKLPSPSKLQTVLRWQYGPRGLTLHGNTGKGKSRCAWELVKREFFAGKTVRALGTDAGFEYARQFAASTEQAARWVESHIAVDLLLLDDVLKVKLTESFESALFGIISGRTEHRRPIIFTTNDSGESLIARMSTDRGEALVRRLREFCESISF